MDDAMISDRRLLDEKIKKIKEGGIDDFYIVSDFDRTLTKASYKGKKIPTSIGLIRSENYLSEEYSKKAWDLFEEYFPYESDNSLDIDFRKSKMLEWWKKHEKLLVESGMNKDIIKKVLVKHPKILRKKADTFFDILNKNNIPLIIFSAGLGDIIKESLENNMILNPNISIISNFFKYNSKGFMEGYKNEVIHIMNKSESSIADDTKKKIKERKNILLLGDNIHDTMMVKDNNKRTILKIGFWNREDSEGIELFKEKFDIIILNDGSMEQINLILEQLFPIK